MLNVGLFGVGHLGRFHLTNLKEISGINVVGIYDPSDENAIAVSKQHQVKRFTDADELIDECDAIIIVAPTIEHFELCKKISSKK